MTLLKNYLRPQAYAQAKTAKLRREARERQAQAEPSKPELSLREYIQEAWSIVEPKRDFISGWHIDAIAEHLEAVSRGEIQYLIVNIPPRHAKSLSVCVFWPTWEWTWWPESRWLTSSYGQSLAIRDALKSRRIIQSPWYQERWGDVFQLTGDQNQKMRYENDRMGYRIATSVGGTGTGEGGDRIIVDDAVKAGDAHSEAKREAANTWWDQTMSTRGNDPDTSAWVVIGQRLHENDLPGYIMQRMERGEEDYELLIIPAEYEPGLYMTLMNLDIEANEYETSLGWSDPRSEPGELIWPERFPRSYVEKQKTKLGSMGTASQLQQHPAPAEGAIFQDQWWRFWQPAGADLPPVRLKLADGTFFEAPVVELPDSFEEKLQSWDMAFKDQKENDFVVGQVWAKKQADRYLLDQVRNRMNIVKTIKAVRDLTAAWPEAVAKLVEDKANGPAVVQLLRSEIPGLIEVTPEGSKVSRANAIVPTIESGNVYLPHPHVAPWVHDYLKEHRFFPVGANDDQVDGTTQALKRWLPKADGDEEAAVGESKVTDLRNMFD
jgi:predicted phage terminase large subunit-like protein